MNLSLVSERLRSGLKNALQLVSHVLRGIEADAARKADPTRRTSMDNLFAVLAFLTATTLVFACIAVGWWVLWRTTLHKIGVFRDLLGLNRAAKADMKRKAEVEILALKSQLRQQHGFGLQHAASGDGKDD